MHVRRIDTKSVPDGDKESNEWLQNLFREKDELQESFHKHGDFFTGSRFEKVEPVLMQRRISSLLNTIGWMFVTLTPILYYLVKLLFSGELLYFSIGAGILLVCKYFDDIQKYFVPSHWIKFFYYSPPLDEKNHWNVQNQQSIIVRFRHDSFEIKWCH